MISIFSQRLKELREQREWTQEYLGSLVNVSDVTINRYEKDNRKPDQELLRSLADIFDVSIDYLLGRTDIKRTPTQQEVALLQQMMSDQMKNTRPPILGGPVEPELPDSSTIDMAKRIENLSDDNKQMIDKMLRALELEEKLKDEGVSGK
jgi:transcriptional regulator with XRE-family HTH domain